MNLGSLFLVWFIPFLTCVRNYDQCVIDAVNSLSIIGWKYYYDIKNGTFTTLTSQKQKISFIYEYFF